MFVLRAAAEVTVVAAGVSLLQGGWGGCQAKLLPPLPSPLEGGGPPPWWLATVFNPPPAHPAGWEGANAVRTLVPEFKAR